MTLATAQSVDFWFDPACPFTWRTSRWLSGVAERRGLDVTWRLMSLAILNEGKELPENVREILARSGAAVRLLEAVRIERGNEALASLYTALGTRVHDHSEALEESTFAAALSDANLPADLIRAGETDEIKAAVAASHAAGQERVGQESGSPLTSVDGGPAFFGPVVVPIPTGAEADRLFDAVTLISSVPAFSELKRARVSF
jgi:2-hydroxychromene-2-carboxylate isomerase